MIYEFTDGSNANNNKNGLECLNNMLWSVLLSSYMIFYPTHMNESNCLLDFPFTQAELLIASLLVV